MELPVTRVLHSTSTAARMRRKKVLKKRRQSGDWRMWRISVSTESFFQAHFHMNGRAFIIGDNKCLLNWSQTRPETVIRANTINIIIIFDHSKGVSKLASFSFVFFLLYLRVCPSSFRLLLSKSFQGLLNPSLNGCFCFSFAEREKLLCLDVEHRRLELALPFSVFLSLCESLFVLYWCFSMLV